MSESILEDSEIATSHRSLFPRMLVRPRDFERRLSLRAKVSASIVFSFLVLMPVIGLSLFYLNQILEDVVNITQFDTTIAEEARQAREHLSAAAETEAALALFRERAYLEQSLREMGQVRQAELTDLDHLESPNLNFQQVLDLVARYNVTMNHLADLYLTPPDTTRPLQTFKRGLELLEDRLDRLDQEAQKGQLLRRHLYLELRKAMLSTPEMVTQAIRERETTVGQLLDELQRIRNSIDASLAAIQTRAEEHIKGHRKDVTDRSNWARRNILTTIVITGIVGIYLVLFLPDRVVRDLRRITHVIQQAERGDLDVATLQVGSDEVGELAIHLNRLMEQVRTFDQLKTERMLQAERRLESVSDSLDEGVLLVDDEMKPVYASQRARELLGHGPDPADSSRLTRILGEKDFFSILRDTLSSREGQANRSFTLDLGEGQPRRFLISTDLVGKNNGEPNEILLLIQESG